MNEVISSSGGIVTEAELRELVATGISQIDLDGKTVAIIIPDDTRSCPLPELLSAVYEPVINRASEVTCVIALGTHEYLTEPEIARWVGGEPAERYPGMRIINHEFKDPETFVTIGRISDERMTELSTGLLTEGADIIINKVVADADVKIIIGPVLPHEVVGMSGGNKYFIPGVAQADMISRTHWVGALITSASIIGTTGITPVRAMINDGAAFISGEHYALCVVVRSHTTELECAAFGDPQFAWQAAAEVAAETHVIYVDEPFTRVISEIPDRYHDIWTAAKGFYKTEPAMADGGEVILYAPHITEVSEVHDEIYEIGYHCRDYFVGQWERFKNHKWGVLAHSTHLAGGGTYDPVTGEEKLRVRVTFATRIPQEVCERINVGYLDPDTIDLDAERARGDTVIIEDAGEVLYRLRQ